MEKPQNGATLELRGGGGRRQGGGKAKDKEAGERAEGREKKRKGEGGRRCRRQVLISNRLLVMRSLSHRSQIDVM